MQVGVSERVGMLKVQRWADAAGIAQASTRNIPLQDVPATHMRHHGSWGLLKVQR
jgi:hypothetical protein